MSAKRTSSRVPGKQDDASPLRGIVGNEVYDVWVKMLNGLVPEGCTHRLSVLVASMLAYASGIAGSRKKRLDDTDPGYPLVMAAEGLDDEEAFHLLKPMLVQLFRDARVKHERVSSRGEHYSILWEATVEFCRWHNYPWEG